MLIKLLKHITFYTVIKRIIVSEKRYRLNKSFQGKTVIASLYGTDIDSYKNLKIIGRQSIKLADLLI